MGTYKQYISSNTILLPNGKPRAMDPKWHCPQFLTFQYLALPAGKNECRKIFRLTAGSGPVAKGAGKISNLKDDLHVVRHDNV